jgi:hypothetical protein
MAAVADARNLRAALAYATASWPVFPCIPGEKVPATSHGVKDATTDAAQIRAWWARNPGRNVAIATGAPGPDVLDVELLAAGGSIASLRASEPSPSHRRVPAHYRRKSSNWLGRWMPRRGLWSQSVRFIKRCVLASAPTPLVTQRISY